MDFLKYLWKPRGALTVPEYGPDDSADLLVKSLIYMFKRLDLANQEDLQRQNVEDMTPEDMIRLDKLYNIEGFERKLQNDPHRVLVDWNKNRFRAMLILAHMPQIDTLPKFDLPNYRFVILESDSSNDEYVRTLSTSDIYIEHNLPIQVRREIAATVLRKYRERNLQTRDMIITDYLRLVATEIQVARIYKAMVSKMPQQNQQNPTARPNEFQTNDSSTSEPHLSQFKSQSRFPTRSSSPSRSPSPVRSKQRSDPLNSKLGNAPDLSARGPATPAQSPRQSPQASPQGSPKRPSTAKFANFNNASKPSKPTSSTYIPRNGVSPSLDAGKKYILQQARLAVKGRIEKEQRILNEQYST